MPSVDGGGPVRPPARVGICLNVRADTESTDDLDALTAQVARFAGTGFTHIELGSNDLGVVIGGRAHPARLRVLREALAACRQRLTLHSSWSGSGRVGNLLDSRWRSAGLEGLLADLDVAVAIGAGVLVYHAGTLAGSDDDAAIAASMAAEREGLRRLSERASDHGIVIAVENRTVSSRTAAARSYGMRLDLLAEQVVAVDRPNVTLCLDTGHAFLAANHLGFDLLDAVRGVAPLVGHIHLADNFGRVPAAPDMALREMEFLGEGDLHLPPGWGSVPLREVLAVPYPLDPIVILEIRHVHHHVEALDAYRDLLPAPGAEQPSGDP